MFLFIIFLIIQSVNSICNPTEYHPCACCDSIQHRCVHNARNKVSKYGSYVSFGQLNSLIQIDTLTYCCVSKEYRENNQIRIFEKYCKRNFNSNQSLVNTIISSCGMISKQCYDRKNVIPPSSTEEEEEMTTEISSFVTENVENKDQIESDEKNEQEMKDDKISIVIPEDNSSSHENTNRANRQISYAWFLILIIVSNFSNKTF